MKINTLLFSLALVALILTACGQKGALYLPEKSPTPTQGKPVDVPVSTDSNDY